MPAHPGAALAHVAGAAQFTAAYVIFIASYVVFALGRFPGLKIDRAGAAIIGSALMVAFRVVNGRQALAAIDFATLVLLFAMMLIVSNLRLAGFFDAVNEWIVSRLQPSHLLPTIIFTCGLLSAFLVNDIVCLVTVPFVLGATRRMGLRPLPHLLAISIASNIGSVATITGNPQNMLIASYSGLGYLNFMAHLAPVALAGLLLNWLIFHWMFGGAQLTSPPLGERRQASRVQPARLRKPLLVLALVVIGFLAGVPPALMAALGAALLLVTRSVEPRAVYQGVDWSLLVFFTGLFIIVGGAESAGIVARLFALAQSWNLERAAPFTLTVVVLSNLVNNIPAVMLLKSLVPHFAHPHTAWLLLAMASTLAGNLTITGSVANMIVAELARGEVEITWRAYARAGIPVALVTIALGALAGVDSMNEFLVSGFSFLASWRRFSPAQCEAEGPRPRTCLNRSLRLS